MHLLNTYMYRTTASNIATIPIRVVGVIQVLLTPLVGHVRRIL